MGEKNHFYGRISGEGTFLLCGFEARGIHQKYLHRQLHSIMTYISDLFCDVIHPFIPGVPQLYTSTNLKLVIDTNLVEKVWKENETKWKRFNLFIFQPFIRILTFSTYFINLYRLLIFLNCFPPKIDSFLVIFGHFWPSPLAVSIRNVKWPFNYRQSKHFVRFSDLSGLRNMWTVPKSTTVLRKRSISNVKTVKFKRCWGVGEPLIYTATSNSCKMFEFAINNIHRILKFGSH